jgi:hypothetical protein
MRGVAGAAVVAAVVAAPRLLLLHTQTAPLLFVCLPQAGPPPTNQKTQTPKPKPKQGTSMSEPGYAGAGEQQQQQQAGDGAHASAAELPASKVKPAAKRAMLRVLSGNKRKLSAQDAGPQMLPPGCSISDPKYSVSTGDPVYFVDHNAGSGGGAAAGKH